MVTAQVFAENEGTSPHESPLSTKAVATFAGGCFWCMVGPFQTQKGVLKVTSGYTGGKTARPSYEQVVTGTTGHYEAVEVEYDSSIITYASLLEIYWRNVNPTDVGGQFADRGKQYQTALFYHSIDQQQQAIASRKKLEDSRTFEDAIVTAILPAQPFYPAETYHQDYHKKKPLHYKQYREGSGRASFLRRMWDKHVDSERIRDGQTTAPTKQKYDMADTAGVRKKLTKEQYDVAVCSATEPPFRNAYWNNKHEGIYVDILSGKPLFSSGDKFNSGTGWPSFTQPIDTGEIIERKDASHGMVRIEVRSKNGDTHLGHLFSDGPAPTGMRYCINSASLRFIPREDLEKEGYGEYMRLFRPAP